MNYYIFALQRSGTNYIEQLMRANYRVNKKNDGGKAWKHHVTIPETLTYDIPTIIMYKNPYLWVESLCFRNSVDWVKTQTKYPATTGLAEFLVGKNKLNIESLAKTYKEWHRNWNTSNPIGYVMKYEDVLQLETRLKHFENIEKRYGLVRKGQQLLDIPKGQVGQSRDYNENRHVYYQSQKTQHLTQKHKNIITSILGPGNIKKWGYDIQ